MRYSAILLALLAAPVMAETANELVPNLAANQSQTYIAKMAPLPSPPVAVSPAVPLTALAAAGVATAFTAPAGGVFAAALMAGGATAIATDSFKPAPPIAEPVARPVTLPVAIPRAVKPSDEPQPLADGPLNLQRHVNTPATKR